MSDGRDEGRSLLISPRLRAGWDSGESFTPVLTGLSTRGFSSALRARADVSILGLPGTAWSAAAGRALPGAGRLDNGTTGDVRVTSDGGSVRVRTARLMTDAGGRAAAAGVRPKTLVRSGVTPGA